MDQLNLFDKSAKGSTEWSAARGVKHDSVGMFRVLSPEKPAQQRFGAIKAIRRFHQPQRLFPSRA